MGRSQETTEIPAFADLVNKLWQASQPWLESGQLVTYAVAPISAKHHAQDVFPLATWAHSNMCESLFCALRGNVFNGSPPTTVPIFPGDLQTIVVASCQ